MKLDDSDLILTWVSCCTDENFSSYLVFFNSLKQVGFSDNIVILTDNLEQKYRDKLKNYTICNVQDFKLGSEQFPKLSYILRDRHLAFWKFLESVDPHAQVLLLDSRDIIFQSNPFLFLHKQLRHCEIILTSEGATHQENYWNVGDQLECQKNVRGFDRPFLEQPVVNGGVIGGKAGKLRDFCFLVWSNNIRCTGVNTDQAILNYLYSFFKYDLAYFLADPRHCPLVAHGDSIKNKLLDVRWVDGKIHLGSMPYSIFHQWDRTEYCEEIIRKYS